ncbi:hypothetical protein [Oceanimonas sp. GK1]|nr:hypothetical protein [Oceanimonas sp. GK1]
MKSAQKRDKFGFCPLWRFTSASGSSMLARLRRQWGASVDKAVSIFFR